MKTQTRLSRHKFISAENITILSVSSDDYIYIYASIYEFRVVGARVLKNSN